MQCQPRPCRHRHLPASPLLTPVGPGARELLRGEGGLRQSRLSQPSFAHFAWRESSSLHGDSGGRGEGSSSYKKIIIIVIKIAQNFPGSRQKINQPHALQRVLGTCFSQLLASHPQGSLRTQPTSQSCPGTNVRPCSGFSTKARGQRLALPPGLQPWPASSASSFSPFLQRTGSLARAESG